MSAWVQVVASAKRDFVGDGMGKRFYFHLFAWYFVFICFMSSAWQPVYSLVSITSWKCINGWLDFEVYLGEGVNPVKFFATLMHVCSLQLSIQFVGWHVCLLAYAKTTERTSTTPGGQMVVSQDKKNKLCSSRWNSVFGNLSIFFNFGDILSPQFSLIMQRLL